MPRHLCIGVFFFLLNFISSSHPNLSADQKPNTKVSYIFISDSGAIYFCEGFSSESKQYGDQYRYTYIMSVYTDFGLPPLGLMEMGLGKPMQDYRGPFGHGTLYGDNQSGSYENQSGTDSGIYLRTSP